MRVRRTNEMLESGLIHPTRAKFVEVAALIMKHKGVAGLHIDDVLEQSGLSRGAMYHHFTNVDELIESALLAVYTEGIEANIALVRSTLQSATNSKEFEKGIFAANDFYVRNEQLRDVRKLRAHAMASTATAPTFAAELASQQQRLTDEYINVIAEAQQRGWVRPDIEPFALAIFIQAYSFGVIVDDVSENHIDSDAWAALIETFFRNCVFMK